MTTLKSEIDAMPTSSTTRRCWWSESSARASVNRRMAQAKPSTPYSTLSRTASRNVLMAMAQTRPTAVGYSKLQRVPAPAACQPASWA